MQWVCARMAARSNLGAGGAALTVPGGSLMFRSRIATAIAAASRRSVDDRRTTIVAALAAVAMIAAVCATLSPARAAAACDWSATPESLSSQVAAATAGQTI